MEVTTDCTDLLPGSKATVAGNTVNNPNGFTVSGTFLNFDSAISGSLRNGVLVKQDELYCRYLQTN